MTRNAYETLIRKAGGKRQVERDGHKWQYNTKTNLLSSTM
jgi:hypothetical protein